MTKHINYEQERKQETREKDKTRTSYIYIHKDSRYKKYAIIEQIQINKHKKKKKHI